MYQYPLVFNMEAANSLGKHFLEETDIKVLVFEPK